MGKLDFELRSKQKIPNEWKNWFIGQKIKFFED